MLMGKMMRSPLLISSFLTHAVRCYPKQTIVSYNASGQAHRYDYSALDTRCRKLATALQDLGIEEGDRVATLAWNDHRHLELYFAVPGIGAVCHTINPRLDMDDIAYILDHAEDKIVFYDPMFQQIVEKLQPLSSVQQWIPLCDSPLSGNASYEDLFSDAQPIANWPEFDENLASGLCYTSGTTGRPKGVLYSHRSTVLHAMSCGLPGALGLTEEDKVLPVVPMFHVNAWGIPHIAALAGSALVLPGPRLDGASLTKVMNDEAVTFAAGVPTIWQGLMDHLRNTGTELATVRELIVGGAALPAPMIDYFEENHSAVMVQGWGMTETSPVCTVSRLRPEMKHLSRTERTAIQVKQGRPIYGAELTIEQAEGTAVGNGELLVRGHWVCDGYLGNDDNVLRDGWFPTGDIATIDNEAYLGITDRIKDVVKSGGEWISSLEIEEAALSHSGISRAAAIGIPDRKWGERPMLVVVTHDGGELPDDLNTHLADKLAKWKCPDRIERIDELPLGATGKVLKTVLRERFAAEPSEEGKAHA